VNEASIVPLFPIWGFVEARQGQSIVRA
jgi:hypothetical protein